MFLAQNVSLHTVHAQHCDATLEEGDATLAGSIEQKVVSDITKSQHSSIETNKYTNCTFLAAESSSIWLENDTESMKKTVVSGITGIHVLPHDNA